MDVHPGGISQLADYYWRDGGFIWIGDAKYKHLAKGQERALRFRDLESEEDESDDFVSLAGQVLSPADVRQLTIYAELVRQREQAAPEPDARLPFCGSANNAHQTESSHGTDLSFG